MTESENIVPKISAVMCCHNEEDSIDELLKRLRPALEKVAGDSHEIILIDDGSSDQTWSKIETAAAADPRVVGLQLSRNFGHQAALTAGLEHSTGTLIFILDADLQDPPELLPEFVQAIENGSDIAYGQRTERLGETAFKKATAALFYKLLNRASDTPVHESVGDFRLVTRKVLDAYLSLPEVHRFSRGLFSWLGGKQTAIPYTRDPRFAGKSQYSLGKMLRLASDALTSFSVLPLRFCGILGLASIAVSFCLFAYIACSYFFLGTARGWTSMAAIVTFFGSIQLISLSIIGEYVGRIFTQNKARPLYIASQAINAKTSVTPKLGLSLGRLQQDKR